MSDASSSRNSARRGRIERVVLAVPRFIAGLLVLVIVGITGANVVARYVFLAPFFWAEEALTYVMISFVYIAAILVTWDGNHLRMDILSQMLRSPWKEIVNFISTVLFILICAFVVTQSLEVTLLQAEYGKRSVAAEIPMVIPHSMVLIGFFFMIVAVVVRFRAHIRGELGTGRDEPPDDSKHKPMDIGV